ncbi:hypothetical protein [Paraburkholderia caribensis]|uniref:hypothetical protein n=1 Tax=Paraburkholderia caribensis TaxID=75105 RepID=UPI001CAD75DC|nr:hypothetical protein [Paraburkholderia caribensis]CAG9269511.1 conserved hypothetical protein [Paraburkholderia caribensis]
MSTPNLPTSANEHSLNVVVQDEGNPALADVPPVPTLRKAMQLTELVESYDDAPISSGEEITRRASNVVVTNTARARTLMTVLEQVRSSYRDRDLRDQTYINFTQTANYVLHRRRDRRGYELPLVFGIAPKARPRGILVTAPVRTGRRCLANTIESLFRREAIAFEIPGSHYGDARYWKVPVIRIQWPIEGKIHGLARNFVGAFDTVMKTDYARRTQSPFFRERDIIPALSALSIASNLGLLIVERINTLYASTRAAETTWDGLAQYTRMTGIPVLCLATTGAAVSGLSKLPGALGDLAPTGPIEILPSASCREKYWIDICKALYDATVGSILRDYMPDWLPRAAYDLTLGYPGILAKALSAIALELHAMQVKSFTAEIFEIYGKKALLLDQSHLDAVKMIRMGGKFTRATLFRHGDWLSFSQLTSLPLEPELE